MARNRKQLVTLLDRLADTLELEVRYWDKPEYESYRLKVLALMDKISEIINPYDSTKVVMDLFQPKLI